MVSRIDPTTLKDGAPASKADLRRNLQVAKEEIEMLQARKADVGHDHDGMPLDLRDALLTRPQLKDVAEVSPTPSVRDGTLTLDLETGNVFEVTLTEDARTVVLANAPDAGRAGALTLILHQDAAGGHALTWPAAVRWPGGGAPVISSAPHAIDIYCLVTRDGGATWYGMVGGKGFG